MLGGRIDAARLHALGLVNEITENGQALSTALALANRLNARAPNSLASIKELLSEAPGATLASQLSQERDHFVRNLHHPNAGIGIAAFLAKETPRYE
jgi:enoyl-CoA hydratase/carnithine racemase